MDVYQASIPLLPSSGPKTSIPSNAQSFDRVWDELNTSFILDGDKKN